MNARDFITNAQIGEPQSKPDGATTLEFKFKADSPVFAGHFPNRPIFPGVFQLELARVMAEQILNCALGVREIRKAKFQRPIMPEETVLVELKLSEKEGTIHARADFSVGGQPVGETILILWRNK